MTTKKLDSAPVDIGTKVHPGLKVFFGYNLYKAGLIYRSLIDDYNIEKYNLSTSECGILYVLSTGNITNQLSLGQELDIDKATIVKIIDKLEKQKLVKRVVDINDRRSKLVSLTAKGEATIEKVKSIRSKIEEDVFAAFSKEDEALLRRLIPQFLEVLLNIKNNA